MVKDFGMVLSGGGAKGAYQVGVFKALKEYDISINSISGSSIGGINGFAYAMLPLDKIISLWENFKLDNFIEIDDYWDDGLSSRNDLESILDEVIDVEKMRIQIPVFNTIAINEYLCEYKLLNNKNKEDIKKILLATSALPIIYSKVEINNVLYQDGGIADNLPVKPLYLNDIKNLIVVSLSQNLRIDKYKYKINNLIEIYPSYSLGDLLDGTLNFSPKFISFAMKLGYYDAKRVLNNYFGISNGCHTKEFDYKQILQEVKIDSINRDILKNMDYIKKFDI